MTAGAWLGPAAVVTGAALVAVHSLGTRRLGRSSGGGTSGWPRRSGGQAWLFRLAVLLAVVAALPPLSSLAGRYVWAETAQAAVWAFAVPPLLVLGAPWAALEAALQAVLPGRPWRQSGRAWRRWDGRGGKWSWAVWVGFAGTLAAWRYPWMVDLVRVSDWGRAAEAVSLVAAGARLWWELVGSGSHRPRMDAPRRIVLTGLSMWSAWVMAFVLGFSGHPWFPGYAAAAGRHLSILNDQEISAGLLWVSAGLGLVPMIFVNLMTWLDGNEELEVELASLHEDEDEGGGAEQPRAASA